MVLLGPSSPLDHWSSIILVGPKVIPDDSGTIFRIKIRRDQKDVRIMDMAIFGGILKVYGVSNPGMGDSR